MNDEILAKAKAAKSADELIGIAKESGRDLTGEQAETLFKSLSQTGEISDDELEYAAGGCAVRAHGQKMVSALNSCGHWKCKYCNEYNGTDLKKKDHYLDEEYLVDCVGACLPESDTPMYSFKERGHECHDCYYCSYERGAWWCNNEPHYNE